MTHICKIPWGSEEVATLQIKVGGGLAIKKCANYFGIDQNRCLLN